MANFQTSDNWLLMIGQAATITTGAIEDMNDGEIGIFTPSGTRMTEPLAATEDRMMIVKKTPNGGVPLTSRPISKSEIKSIKAVTYQAATNKIVNIGYDGSNGFIDVFNDNDYLIRVNLDQTRTSNHGGLYTKHVFYTSDASATQYEVAENLVQNFIAEFSKEPDQLVTVEMLSDDAGAALSGGPATLSVKKNGKFVVASSGSHGVVAGDVLRIGGTATTTPVYTVKSVSGTTIELTVPYQGATATGLAGETLTALTGAFGIKVTGVTLPFTTGKLEQDLKPNNFDILLDSFGTTTLNVAQGAYAGRNTERQMKALEFFAQGIEGDPIRAGEPTVFPSRAEASGNYDTIEIELESNSKQSMVLSPNRSRYTLAIPATTPNYAVTGTSDDITDVLEVFAFGSTTGNPLNL